MTHTAIIFGVRLAVFVMAAAVVYAFFRAARQWLWKGENENRLASGICLLAVGSLFTGPAHLASLVAGPEFLEMYISGTALMLIGLAILLLAYYMCFTAWLSETKDSDIGVVSIIALLVVSAVIVFGVWLYGVLTA